MRIVAGTWRGRKLGIADVPGLRPTADRVRETLFNWLAADVADARCLDLFAGTGALGIEALSRGAAHCCFVEQSPHASDALSKSLQKLEAQKHATVFNVDALKFLAANQNNGDDVRTFDLAFLDPPFADDLLTPALDLLIASNCLSPNALIYFEHAADSSLHVPREWQVRRHKQTGDVSFGLLERD